MARVAERAGVSVGSLYQEALPNTSRATRARACNLLATTLTAAGKRFSESPRTRAQIEDYAGDMADMFCAYLGSLAGA